VQTVDQILAYINSHGIDKVAPIVVSLVALAFSFLSYRQKDKEGKLGLRKQLTEILEKLTNLNVEDAKARSQSEDYPLNYTGIINDNRRFLVRQAAYLAMQLDTRVSPYEYRIIADGFSSIHDVFEAGKFYEMGIQTAPVGFDKAIILRAYARFLFREGRRDDATRFFEKSLAEVSGSSDRAIYHRMECYERWAALEGDVENLISQIDLLSKAAAEAERYSEKSRRKKEYDRINTLLERAKAK